MSIALIGEAFLIGLCFVSWAVVGGRYAGGTLLATAVAFLTAAIVGIFSFRTLQTEPFAGVKALTIVFVLGSMNGLGFVRYTDRLARPDVPTAPFIVTVSVAVVMIAPILQALSGSGRLSSGHLVGYICAVCAVFFLSR